MMLQHCGSVVWHCRMLCGMVRHGIVWCGVVWCGVVWCGVVWCGVVWGDVAWYGRCCMVLHEWSVVSCEHPGNGVAVLSFVAWWHGSVSLCNWSKL